MSEEEEEEKEKERAGKVDLLGLATRHAKETEGECRRCHFGVLARRPEVVQW